MRTLTVVVERREGLTVFSPVGEIDNTVRPVLDEAAALLPNPVGTVRVDMAGVTFMDSGGVRFLIDLRRRVQVGGGRFNLTALQCQPERVLRLAGQRLVEVSAMDGPRLTSREQWILTRLETALSQDERLERRLRTLHLSAWARCTEDMHRVRPRALAVLAAISASLLVAAILTAAPVLVVAFAAMWAVTLVFIFMAVRAWTRCSRPGRRRTSSGRRI
jgi:anti-anti-sigma factor